MPKNHHRIEAMVRNRFNTEFKFSAKKVKMPIGDSSRKHEFDIYEQGEVIGGISTSPWINKTKLKSNNTGGQDRVAAELLWLSLWDGSENRVQILTDRQMANQTFERFKHGSFPRRITIYRFTQEKGFEEIGVLGRKNKKGQ